MIKLDILAIAPHPDDVELGCGGTLAKAVAEGKKVGIIDLTQGELGTRGSAEIRLKEADKAKEILGVHVRENLKMQDGFFKNDKENQFKLIEAIRKYQPEIVITGATEDRHPDHARATQLIVDACFLSGLPRIQTEQNAWRPKRIFHFIQWRPLQPDFVVDISGFLDLKVKSCLAYASQFHDPKSDEPSTAISSQNFTESIAYRAKDWGRLVWKDAGEAFISESLLAVDSLDAFI